MPERFKTDDDLSLNIGEPDEDKDAKKKINTKMLLFILLMILIVGGAGGAWFFSMKDSGDKTDVPEQAMEKKPVNAIKPVIFSNIVHLGSFNVQLGDMGGEKSFKVGIELDVDTPALGQELSRRSSQIESTVKAFLANKTFNEIQGSDGKIILKNELIAHLNRMLETGKVRNVYFSEFIIF